MLLQQPEMPEIAFGTYGVRHLIWQCSYSIRSDLVWFLHTFYCIPSVLWHCWLGVRKSTQSVKIEWWNVDVTVCLEQGADCLHVVQLMPLPSQNSNTSCLISIQTGFTFLVPVYPDWIKPGKKAVNRCSSNILLHKWQARIIVTEDSDSQREFS